MIACLCLWYLSGLFCLRVIVYCVVLVGFGIFLLERFVVIRPWFGYVRVAGCLCYGCLLL